MKERIYLFWKRFLTWFGDLYFATEPPLCKAKHIEIMLEKIKPGDIICRGYNYYLDSYFIPGEYTHSGIVINNREMIHSIAEGVESIHPVDFIKDTDRFVVIRPRYKSPRYLSEVLERAIWHCEYNDTQYDFLFNDPDKFYCHEFTVDCLHKGMIFPKKSCVSYGMLFLKFKKNIYLAKDLIQIGSLIYEFKGEENEKK